MPRHAWGEAGTNVIYGFHGLDKVGKIAASFRGQDVPDLETIQKRVKREFSNKSSSDHSSEEGTDSNEEDEDDESVDLVAAHYDPGGNKEISSSSSMSPGYTGNYSPSIFQNLEADDEIHVKHFFINLKHFYKESYSHILFLIADSFEV
jgi:hypothetical protein